ncbi:MAG: glycosyltransferase family 4 protein [Armatimonadota bacterium]
MDSKLSVVQLLRPSCEQLQEHVLSLATYLPRRQFDVTVVGELDRALQDALTRSSVRWVNVDIASRGAHLQRRDLTRLRRLVESLRARIVHIHGHDVVAVGTGLAAGGSEPLALVYTAHELSGYQSGALALPWGERQRYRRLLSAMDAIITFSQRDRQALATINPGAAAHAEVIPPGVDTRRLRPLSSPGTKRRQLGLMLHSAVVGTVTELEKHTGIETFLAAAEIVTERLPNIEFVVVGEGSQRQRLEKEAHRRRLSGSTLFLGRRWDLPEVLGALNVVAVTTEADGGVQTALQALALGLPVVATDTGGLREVLGDLEDVPLVPPGDPQALADALCSHLEMPPQHVMPTGGLVTAEGLVMTERDMLVTTQAFDIDLPGAQPVERRRLKTPGAELARRYGIAPMIRQTVAVYRRLLEVGKGDRGSAGRHHLGASK